MNVVTIPTNVTCCASDETTSSTRTSTTSSPLSPRRSRSEQERASRCWSAPCRSRSRRCCQRISRQGRRPARGAERPLPRERGAYRRPGRAASARSPSPPTWPAAAPTSSSAATSISASRTSSRTCPRAPSATRRSPRSRDEVAEEKRARARRRRAVRARHRAPRKPPHRQPAARPFGPSGRSGPVALLPQPRRRSAAHLRPADDVLAADEQEPRGRRGDRLPVDFEGDRDRAEKGRGAQLRHPQAGRRIRRRHERPAQGHLRAARRDHGRGACLAT